jgi:hypothetical protein
MCVCAIIPEASAASVAHPTQPCPNGRLFVLLSHATERRFLANASYVMPAKRTPEEQRAFNRERRQTQRQKLSQAKKKVIREHDTAAHAKSKAAMSVKERQHLRASDARCKVKTRAAKRIGARRFVLNRVHRYAQGSAERNLFEQLAEDGFCIIHAAIPKRWLASALRQVDEEVGVNLFYKHGNLMYSGKRKMYHLHGAFEAEVVTWTERVLEEALKSKYKVIEACILNNKKVAAQPAHVDIKDASHLWLEDFPLACIIALQDTSILVMRNSLQSLEGQLERVSLKRGDVFCMHGLTVHAGDEFEDSNTRLHAVALPEGITRSPVNETHVIPSST